MSGDKLAGFPFRTASGNRYWYDDNSGLVFACPDVMWETLKLYTYQDEHEISAALSPRFGIASVSAYYRLINQWDTGEGAFLLSRRPERAAVEIGPDDVGEHLKSNGFIQLILIVTEDCNLRCRYCVFSDSYPFMRNQSAKRMSFDTARKAVDYYYSMLSSVTSRNPYRQAVISFYGGEPLLNLSCIREVIDYVASTYNGPAVYNLTTNGTLLDDKVADYLVEKEVSIAVSLDGPEQEHDRARVDRKGNGSFKRVYGNLKRLLERHPGYTKSIILSCYDCATNLESVKEFFEGHNDVLPAAGRASQVNNLNCSYFEQYGPEDWTRMYQQLWQLESDYIDTVTAPGQHASDYLERIVGTGCRMILMRPLSTEKRLKYLPFTKPCFPGDKIAVDADGTFHICEKMSHLFPIGDVDHGIDCEKIASVINAYNHRITDQCASCSISRLCTVCYSMVAGDGEFAKSPHDLCSRLIEGARRRLGFTYSILERNPEAYKDILSSHMNRISESRSIDF